MFDFNGMIKKALTSAEVQALISTLKEELACLKGRLAAMETMLAYEHGLPVQDVRPHDPRRLPFVHRLEGVSQERLNLTPALGKPVTRGHVSNIGDAKAMVTFVKAATPEERVEYLLLPGTTLDFSWFFDALEVAEAGEGPVSVQVLAQ